VKNKFVEVLFLRRINWLKMKKDFIDDSTDSSFEDMFNSVAVNYIDKIYFPII
jgi:hypothetical protein